MNPLLSDSTRRVAGTRQIMRLALQGKLSAVYVATDAEPKVRERIIKACREGGVPVEEADTMAELGQACKIAVGAAAAGILADDM